MTVRGETTQFTARIENRLLAVLKRLAAKENVSANEKLNEVLILGMIALAQKRKAAVAAAARSHNST